IYLRIDIHLLDDDDILVARELLHRDVLANVLLLDDLLLEPRRGALGEAVVALLLAALVGLDVVAHQLRRLVLLDHAHVDVAAGPQVVEDTRLDGLRRERDRLLPVQVRLPVRLED
ncbi:hypothetical protein T310_9222, partial [Rasamsonia emersonii CBS 393.64]